MDCLWWDGEAKLTGYSGSGRLNGTGPAEKWNQEQFEEWTRLTDFRTSRQVSTSTSNVTQCLRVCYAIAKLFWHRASGDWLMDLVISGHVTQFWRLCRSTVVRWNRGGLLYISGFSVGLDVRAYWLDVLSILIVWSPFNETLKCLIKQWHSTTPLNTMH